MKICYLADAQNIHTKKWVGFFAERGHRVDLVTFLDSEIEGVRVHTIKRWFPIRISPSASSVEKIGYMFYVRAIREIIEKISPDILHAHWASSYGFLGACSGYRPYVLSTWGGDVFDFPHRSALHRKILEFTINSADYITSTSIVLREETRKFLKRDTELVTIPFGVDMIKFKPAERKERDFTVIGIVKTLEKKYGIEYLIKAFSILSERRDNIELVIIGRGSRERSLRLLCKKLKIEKRVRFLGFIQNDLIPAYLNGMDIFVVPSVVDSEAFGVAAVEAAACGLPVVASNVGGLSEVVVDNRTGFLVPPADSEAIAEKLDLLIEDSELRKKLGREARRFVEDRYEWESNASSMERIYHRVLKR